MGITKAVDRIGDKWSVIYVIDTVGDRWTVRSEGSNL